MADKCYIRGRASITTDPNCFVDLVITWPGGGGAADHAQNLRVLFEHSGVCGSEMLIDYYAGGTQFGQMKVFCADC